MARHYKRILFRRLIQTAAKHKYKIQDHFYNSRSQLFINLKQVLQRVIRYTSSDNMCFYVPWTPFVMYRSFLIIFSPPRLRCLMVDISIQNYPTSIAHAETNAYFHLIPFPQSTLLSAFSNLKYSLNDCIDKMFQDI